MITAAIASALRPLPYFRGRGRLTDWLAPRTGTRSASIYGQQMNLDLSDLIQRGVYFGNYEPRETRLVKDCLLQGETFVDVGANIGYFTALASHLVGTAGRVVSFEPSPTAFASLNQTFQAAPNVTCLQAALSDADVEIRLFVPPRGYGNHDPSVHRYCAGMEEVAAPARRLDSVAEQLGIAGIDFLKIDVEGHELSVMAGAERLLRKRAIRRVLCEFNPVLLAMAGFKTADLLMFFRDWGFNAASNPQEDELCNVLLVLG